MQRGTPTLACSRFHGVKTGGTQWQKPRFRPIASLEAAPKSTRQNDGRMAPRAARGPGRNEFSGGGWKTQENKENKLSGQGLGASVIMSAYYLI